MVNRTLRSSLFLGSNNLPEFPKIPQLRQAFFVQETIGWSSFIEGRINFLWAEVQLAWYRYLKQRNTGQQWASQLIQKLLNIAWDQWEHRNGINNLHLDNAHHQYTSRLVSDEIALGLCGLSGNSKRMFLLGPSMLRQSSRKQESWLANIQAARRRLKAKQELAEASFQKERRIMQQWLLG